jgi:hypothetical protein
MTLRFRAILNRWLSSFEDEYLLFLRKHGIEYDSMFEVEWDLNSPCRGWESLP